MKELTKLRKQLDLIGHRLKIVRQIWSQHIDKIRLDSATLETSHSNSALKPNAWATKQSCSLALARIEAIDQNLQERYNVLKQWGVSFNHGGTLQEVFLDYLTEPIGPEARAWQIVCAIVEVQDRVREGRLAVESTERDLSERLAYMAKLHGELQSAAIFDEWFLTREHESMDDQESGQSVNRSLKATGAQRSGAIEISDQVILEKRML